jgi:bile acid-coenzyme A ligase
MAAPCPAWLKEAWIGWLGGDRILELYGGTEGQAITFITGDEWLQHRGSVGRPLFGEIRILDADGNELAAAQVGEIWMRRGEDAPPTYRYVGALPKSRPGKWESLGDMGWKDEQGYIYVSDRETDMILVGGSNVYPAEVEAALDEHPKVASSCVIGLPDEEYGNVVHAIVQALEPLTVPELDGFLASRLASYKRPRTDEFVTEPLRGDDGKVRRTALRAERAVARARPGGTVAFSAYQKWGGARGGGPRGARGSRAPTAPSTAGPGRHPRASLTVLTRFRSCMRA